MWIFLPFGEGVVDRVEEEYGGGSCLPCGGEGPEIGDMVMAA